jgi:hypothetical protein
MHENTEEVYAHEYILRLQVLMSAVDVCRLAFEVVTRYACGCAHRAGLEISERSVMDVAFHG